ncbi:Zn(2+)-responsive transcriptional regulator [Vibrio mangrovi]|uniref:HTH-type transcriptional regulator ZntR n=1 Tax=Vibrio mangrovi TaxID=474394 RepID=A0A1Y6IV23_9VIBR|nr:Zn(2+)-responsive transcriptional regulator [Vibrio mangrovi]MDW6001309.1 Zn(2+)-responsive transcriptional regulator [Vibrio mangrovi]SMS00670.1 HTH-type transcriptional regulator ZntR [Vibrio mangrovi]
MTTLKRGQLAKEVGISPEAIRYYERQGLLQAGRDSNGYRRFDVSCIDRLKFIQRAQSVGLSLKEIGELLELEIARGEHTCEEVKAITQAKQQEIQQKIRELQHMYDALTILNNRCCGGSHSAEHCTILTALADTESTEEVSHEHNKTH